jgi:hypothetical protein
MKGRGRKKTAESGVGNGAVLKEAKAKKPVGHIGGEEYATPVQPETMDEATAGPRLGRKRGGAAKFIQAIGMKKGALRKELHVPEGEKIPEAKLDKAAHSSNPKLRKRAVLAKTLKSFH